MFEYINIKECLLISVGVSFALTTIAYIISKKANKK